MALETSLFIKTIYSVLNKTNLLTDRSNIKKYYNELIESAWIKNNVENYPSESTFRDWIDGKYENIQDDKANAIEEWLYNEIDVRYKTGNTSDKRKLFCADFCIDAIVYAYFDKTIKSVDSDTYLLIKNLYFIFHNENEIEQIELFVEYILNNDLFYNDKYKRLECPVEFFQSIKEQAQEKINNIIASGYGSPKAIKTNIKFSQNKFFTGREELLKSLKKRFSSKKEENIQVLQGLGGVGKTQIALEYAHREWNKYDYIWWINAEKPAQILEAYRDFALANALIKEDEQNTNLIIETVRNWLDKNDGWLFIFDNYEIDEGSSYSINWYLPHRTSAGHILITTRDSLWTDREIIPIEIFQPDEAVAFILTRTELNNHDGASTLAEELGYLPLALEQAAAYMKNRKKTFAEYIEIYKKYQIKVFENNNFKPKDYNATVATTWQISFDRIGMEAAKELLKVCGFLSSDDIRIEMFIKGKEYLPYNLASIIEDEFDLTECIHQLTRYSLMNENNMVLSMHRLVQDVVIYEPENKEYLKVASDLVLYKIDMIEFKTLERSKYLHLMPHFYTVVRHLKSNKCEYQSILILNSLIAYYHLINLEEIDYAKQLYEENIKIVKMNFPFDRVKLIRSLEDYAYPYIVSENFNKIEMIFKEIIWIFSETFEDKPYELLVVVTNGLSDIYFSRGEYSKILKICEFTENILNEIQENTRERISILKIQTKVLYALEQGEIARMIIYDLVNLEEELSSEIRDTSIKWLVDLAEFEIDKERYEQAEFLLDIGIQNLTKFNRIDSIEMYLINEQQVKISHARNETEKTNHLYNNMKNISMKVFGEKHSHIKEIDDIIDFENR